MKAYFIHFVKKDLNDERYVVQTLEFDVIKAARKLFDALLRGEEEAYLSSAKDYLKEGESIFVHLTVTYYDDEGEIPYKSEVWDSFILDCDGEINRELDERRAKWIIDAINPENKDALCDELIIARVLYALEGLEVSEKERLLVADTQKGFGEIDALTLRKLRHPKTYKKMLSVGREQ